MVEAGQPQLSDEEVDRRILERLGKAPMSVWHDSEMKERLQFDGVSKRRTMRRLGSLIKRKLVLRCRREMESKDDRDRPIVYRIHPRGARS